MSLKEAKISSLADKLDNQPKTESAPVEEITNQEN